MALTTKVNFWFEGLVQMVHLDENHFTLCAYRNANPCKAVCIMCAFAATLASSTQHPFLLSVSHEKFYYCHYEKVQGFIGFRLRPFLSVNGVT